MKIFGQHDEQTLRQLEDVASRARRAALMADGHLGYVMPIGGVAGYHEQVSVTGVGFDIACGNAAILTDLHADGLHNLDELADEIQDSISFGVGRSNRSRNAPVDHPLFQDPAWDAVPAPHRHTLREKARSQLGTVGSGNHYFSAYPPRVVSHQRPRYVARFPAACDVRLGQEKHRRSRRHGCQLECRSVLADGTTGSRSSPSSWQPAKDSP